MKWLAQMTAGALAALGILAAAPTALAQSCQAGVCVIANQPLLSVDASDSALLNPVLSALLPGTDIDLSVLDYQGLAQADVDLNLFIDILQARVGAAEPGQALDADISLLDLIDITADALEADGNVAAIGALNALRIPLLELENSSLLGGAINGLTIPVSSLIQTDFPTGALADVDINVLSLLTAGVQLFNYENAAQVKPIGINNDNGLLTMLGLGGVVDRADLQFLVVEPLAIKCAPEGASFSSSSIRFKLTVDLLDVNVGQSPLIDVALGAISALLPGVNVTANGEVGQLQLYGEIGRSEATLLDVNVEGQTATLEAQTGTVDLYLGELDEALFFDRNANIDPDRDLGAGVVGDFQLGFDAPLIGSSTLDLGIRARSHTQGRSNREQLFFDGPYPETQKTFAGTNSVPGAVANLFDNLELEIDLERGGSSAVDAALGLTDIVIDQVLDILLPTLDTVVGDVLLEAVDLLLANLVDAPVFDLLGVGFGEASYTVLGVAQLCSTYGRVYLDENHSAARETGESGTGQNLFIKLIPLRDDGLDARQVVSVDPTSGFYSLPPVASGRYRLVLDDNDNLSDITPTLPAGFINTEVPTGSREITVGTGASPGQNFGVYAGSVVDVETFIDTGTDGGTANNAIRDGGERGLGNARVEVRQGGTVLADATTTESGRLRLWIPGSFSGEFDLCEIDPPGYRSSGAMAGPDFAAASYNADTDCLTLNIATGRRYSGVQFADVPRGRWGPSRRGVTTVGGSVVYGHRFRAGSHGNVRFSRSASRADWQGELFVDTECDGLLGADDVPIPENLSVEPDNEVCILLRETTAEDARPGQRQISTLTAEFTPDGTANYVETLELIDLSIVVAGSGDGGITLSKRADREQVLPGDLVTYTLAYSNQTDSPISEVIVRDSLPAYTEFVSAECVQPFPAGIESCSVESGAGNSGEGIRWSLTGALEPGAIGEVRFTVRLEE